MRCIGRERALSRLVAAALAPAKGAWGARWRLDASFAAALPQEMNLGDPRAFALALVEHNDLEALCAPVTPLVDDAERFGGLKAAWLAPYLPRTVNGTGHTGPSEFCATSI